MKYYAYLRCSTLTQMEKNGFQMQRDVINRFLAENGVEVEEWFYDEGISGTEEDREGLYDLLGSLSKGDKVIVQNTSRLWRNDAVKVFVHKELIKAGADICSVEQEKYSVYDKDPTNFLFNSIMEILDAYERMTIAAKLRKGRKAKAKSGSKACGTAPIGYKWDGAEIKVVPEEAEFVRYIFKTYIDLNKNYSAVKRKIDNEGHLTKQGKLYSVQGIKNILSNDFYIGVVTHGGKKYKGKHEPIITKELFKMAN